VKNKTKRNSHTVSQLTLKITQERNMSYDRNGGNDGNGPNKYVPPFMRKKMEEDYSRDRKHPTASPYSGSNYSNGGRDHFNGSNADGDSWKNPRYTPYGGRGGARDGRDRFNQGYGGKDGRDTGRGQERVAYTREEASEEELFSKNNTGINFDKYENIPVETFGKNIPQPIDDFKSANFPTSLQRNIELAKFTKPTPVQRYSIPIVMESRDLMACAQTGSGKTGGFLFPTISRLLKDGSGKNFIEEGEGRDYVRKAAPSVLVLAPTRELTTQIYDEARKFTFRTGLRSVVVYGGTDIRYQINQCSRGCEILVATPGRLVDLIDRGIVTLQKIQYLILDEADRMLDMGFEQQIRYIVEKANMPEAGKRVTLMFSATFPKNIQKLAADFLYDYVFLTVGRVGSTTENITQQFELCSDFNKKDLLLQHLNKNKEGLTLIFVQTKKEADYLEDFLVQNGFRTSSIHGDRSQREREFALRNFKRGVTPILVATDVASRGLDIENVSHVINYDMPENIDDYVHRIGRTGRAGNTGRSTAFFTDKNKNMANEIIKLLEETNQQIPDFLKRFHEENRTYKNQSYGRYGGGRGGSRGGGRGGHPFGRVFGGGRGGYGSRGGY
jgi:ATP-dependent RNA helicase DDX3X